MLTARLFPLHELCLPNALVGIELAIFARFVRGPSKQGYTIHRPDPGTGRCFAALHSRFSKFHLCLQSMRPLEDLMGLALCSPQMVL